MADKALISFFKPGKTFAVVGASPDTSKFGYKILAWYVAHKLPVVAINPKKPAINIGNNNVKVLASLDDLQSNASSTSVSFVTPPAVTLKELQRAKKLGISAVWLQPGTFDDAVNQQLAKDPFETAIGNGRCILIEGERGLGFARNKL